ncbi:MAG: hypothetical protein H0U76_25305 [Ktedonobacteraceae bacterium]|nr:hypothetical protein [Ktedonobacteraceae bacterium]
MNRTENAQATGVDRRAGAITTDVEKAPQEGLSIYLTVTALGLIVVLLLSSVLGVLDAPTGISVSEKIASLASKLTLQQAEYIVDAFIPLFNFGLVAGVGLFVETDPSLRYLSRIGVLFASIYAALSVSLYIGLLVLVYILAQGGSIANVYWPLWALAVPTFSHLSYAIFGIGAIMVSVGLMRERGARRWGGWSLCATGIIFILAFPAQVVIGFEPALLMLWLGGLAAISFAVAMIVYVRGFGSRGHGAVSSSTR